MYSKIVALSALLAAVNAAFVGHGQGGAVSFQSIVHHDQPAHYAAPVAQYTVRVVHHAAPVAHYATSRATYNARPRYNYAYSVADPDTAYQKSQYLSRDGYYPQAQYNSYLRKVEYSANLNGFNAVLRNSAASLHPAPIYEEDDQLY